MEILLAGMSSGKEKHCSLMIRMAKLDYSSARYRFRNLPKVVLLFITEGQLRIVPLAHSENEVIQSHLLVIHHRGAPLVQFDLSLFGNPGKFLFLLTYEFSKFLRLSKYGEIPNFAQQPVHILIFYGLVKSIF